MIQCNETFFTSADPLLRTYPFYGNTDSEIVYTTHSYTTSSLAEDPMYALAFGSITWDLKERDYVRQHL